jgi:hypothetical protein
MYVGMRCLKENGSAPFFSISLRLTIKKTKAILGSMKVL